MRGTWTQALAAVVAVAVAVVAVPRARAAVTDEQVQSAIQKGKEYLINQQNADGSFTNNEGTKSCLSALVFMTLAYMGEHPNRDVMSKGLDYLMRIDARGFTFDNAVRAGYAVPIRVMGFSYIHNKLLGDKRAEVRRKMMEDVLLFRTGQSRDGGWRYELNAQDYDFSVTQWPILAMREASLVGIEMPVDPLRKAQKLYFDKQNEDGGWHYQSGKSYGSMTAAGLASLFIINDILDPSSGCPCSSGKSRTTASEAERRIDKALEWLGKYFTGNANAQADGTPGNGRTRYWLYCVERVGIAAGYKRFGDHNWYKEGAEHLVATQEPRGNWGGIDDTCFALLFLYKGRAPVLFNKLRHSGVWNAHRRDLANLTNFIERDKEQMFHWQIVELRDPLDELHEAPVLYLTAESPPEFSKAEKEKLRAFTDTGGTILVEASCGNAGVRRWFKQFASEVWPEWPLVLLPPKHDTFEKLTHRVELLGIHDGMRTCVFYSPDDVSCHWQTQAYAAKDYLFKWGINLYTYATDGAPLRAKLQSREPAKSDRYKDPVKAGAQTTVRIARVKYGGNWENAANYAPFKILAKQVKAKANVTLEVKESNTQPVTEGGVPVAELKGYTAAYLTGSREFTFTAEEKEGLKAYVDGGGFLWAEAGRGSIEFDRALREAIKDLGWELKPLDAKTHPLVTGRMDPALGYNLGKNVQFRRELREKRLLRRFAEFEGIFAGDKLVGVYSPLDILFSLTPYEASKCLGYKDEDAAAAATNVILYLTTRPAP